MPRWAIREVVAGDVEIELGRPADIVTATAAATVVAEVERGLNRSHELKVSRWSRIDRDDTVAFVVEYVTRAALAAAREAVEGFIAAHGEPGAIPAEHLIADGEAAAGAVNPQGGGRHA